LPKPPNLGLRAVDTNAHLRDDSAHHSGRLIERKALLERLDLARIGRVSLVQAPAGYGKSTLLSAWHTCLTRQQIEVVSISLEEELATPQRFFSVLRRVVCESSSHASRPVREYSDRHRAQHPERALAASLSSRTDPLVIILDDYHRVAGEELDLAFGEFLKNLPPTVHVAISSRPPVEIPLAIMSIASAVTMLELKDLRFTDAEINDLFSQELSAEELASISVWTEGWPIAVQLARTYLEDVADRKDVLARLSTEADQDVGGYLTEQVLRRLPAADRDFLVATSFLDRLDPDIVEAVTGTQHAWRVLQRLAAAYVLVAEPEGAENSASYRCHHLLREVLYSELHRRGRVEVLRLRARAARWLRQRGELEEALRHGRAAEDYELVSNVILEMGGILYGIRQGSPELRRLLEYVPHDVLSESPRLMLAQSFELAKEGRLDAARDVIRGVRARVPSTVDTLLTRDLALAEISVAAYSGATALGSDQIAALERAIRDAHADDILGQAILNNLLAAIYYQSSDFPNAAAAGEAALYNYGRASAANGIAHTHLHLGLIHAEQGNIETALEHWRAAKAQFGSGECVDESGCALANALIAEALYEKGELREARALCQSALIDMEDGEHFYPAFVSACRTLSGITLLQDGLAASLRMLDGAIRLARRRRLFEVERFLDLRRTEVQLQAGEFSRLHAESRGEVQVPWTGYKRDSRRTWYESDFQALLEARLTLQDGDAEAAISQLRELDSRCQQQGRARTRVSILILTAAAHQKARRRDAALAVMRQAIIWGAKCPTLRAFLEDGRLAVPLLVHLSASAKSKGLGESEVAFVSQVLRLLQSRGPAADMLFTARELEILQQLVLHNNNKLIARALGVTPDTVRFHLKKIYEKLGVNDRKVVCSLIRERGLLSTQSPER